MTRRTWIVGYGSLTQAQRQIVELDDVQDYLITGPAGSGKTLLMLHRARHFLGARRYPAERVRALVYTKVLKRYLQSGSDELGLAPGTVQSFHSWLWGVAKTHGIELPRGDGYDERIAEAERSVAAAFESRGTKPFLDAVLVDEGQDLSRDAYRILVRIAKHVTVFGDETQRLYDVDGTLQDASRLLRLGRRSPTLLQNLRNTKGVALAASCLLGPARAAEYLKSQSVETLQWRRPLWYHASSTTDEWERLAEIVQAELRDGKSVGIVLPTNRLVGRVGRQLEQRGIECEKVLAWKTDEVDFNSLAPKLMTIHGAKGLTFQTVLIPCAEEAEYARLKTPIGTLLFVAMTRALEWVYVSAVHGREAGALAQLADRIHAGDVMEQWRDGVASTAEEETEIEFDDDIPF